MDAGPYVLNEVDASTYEQLAGLEGITVYHLQPWHRVLQRAFGWRASMCLRCVAYKYFRKEHDDQ